MVLWQILSRLKILSCETTLHLAFFYHDYFPPTSKISHNLCGSGLINNKNNLLRYFHKKYMALPNYTYYNYTNYKNFKRKLSYNLHENRKCISFSISSKWQKEQILKFIGVLGIVCVPVSIRNW